MNPEMMSAIAAVLAAAVGWGMWWNGRRDTNLNETQQKADKASGLFDDALSLAQAQKDLTEQHKQAAEDARAALESVTVKARQLEVTIAGLMDEVDKWRGVAVAVAQEHKQATGAVPLAWPKGEPLPVAV